MSNSICILQISDLHYASRAATPEEALQRSWGSELLRRIVRDARRISSPDVIILTGDIVHRSDTRTAEADLAEIANLLRSFDLPFLAIPGNHDNLPSFNAIMEQQTGSHVINGFSLYTFNDPYNPDDQSMRRPDGALQDFLAEPDSSPVIAIQHSPVYPDVPSEDFPYMPLNVGEIREAYRKKGVLLSLSGHYHEGAGPVETDGTTYLTAPAAASAPFPYTVIRVCDGKVEVERQMMKQPEFSQLTDGHIHTHFGYCAVDVHPVPVRERLERLGVKKCVFVEHAPQLYMKPEDFWIGKHIEDTELLRRSTERGENRMQAYREGMKAFRTENSLIGLEVEVDRTGELTLLEEDRRGWDVLLGAIHWIPKQMPFDSDADVEKTFMWIVEQLASYKINVLAHPFRILHQRKRATPEKLPRRLAQLLKAHDVAAEINFHIDTPEEEFFRICLEEGVRIAVGSDSHELHEVADINPHVRLLRRIGQKFQE